MKQELGFKIKMNFIKNQKQIEKIVKKYKIKLLLLFGSQINNKTHQLSDIDIGCLFENNQISFAKYSNLLHDLNKMIPGKKVDVAVINHADPLFLAKILENCQTLFGKKQDLDKLKLYSFHQFCDFQKYFDLEQEFARNFIYDKKNFYSN